jgi:PAS domain S-box-containing protein
MFFGIGPGIASVFSTAIIFYYRFLLPGSSSPFAVGSVVRVVLIVGIGLVLAFLSQRQRTIGLRLRSALASLREHADTLAQAQQGSRSAAWVLHTQDGSLQWAHGGAELLGRPFEGIDRLDSLIDLAWADDRPAIERAVENTRKAGTLFHVEFRAALPNGDTRWLEMRGAPSPPDPMLWRGVVLDVTERKNTEIALVRSEKLAAIGRLSATVAHEINNPLEAVTNLLYLASSEPALPSGAKKYLHDADHELQRLASIARHTLTYARTKPDDSPTDIAPIAESVVAMFRTRCHSRGGQVRFISSVDLRVTASRDDLRQILTNLVSNSCDALPGAGGLVEIEVFGEGESAVIVVRDNGSGISQKDLERIFDAFFSTKDDVGTGIGLWVTKELVEKNGGRISVVSGAELAPFRTSFRVELPLSGVG